MPGNDRIATRLIRLLGASGSRAEIRNQNPNAWQEQEEGCWFGYRRLPERKRRNFGLSAAKAATVSQPA
jgi:hypothetical protein